MNAPHTCQRCGDVHYGEAQWRQLGQAMLLAAADPSHEKHTTGRLAVAVANAAIGHDLDATLAAMGEMLRNDRAMFDSHPDMEDQVRTSPLGAIAAIAEVTGAVHDVIVGHIERERRRK